MFVLRETDCGPITELVGRRATLTHDWLKNQVLVELRSNRREWEAVQPGDPLPEVFAALPEWLEEVRQCTKEMIDHCSPAQVVDCEPLASLPPAARQLIKEIMHQAYLDLEAVQSDGRKALEALEDLENAAERLRRAWIDVSDRKKKAGLIDRVEKAATHLKQSLELSQDGIVVP